MTILGFLSLLQSLDIRISARDGKLRVDAPKGAVTEDIRDELARRKSELLQLLEEARPGSAMASDAIPLVSRGSELVPSFSQQRMWLISQLEPDSLAYNMSSAALLKGSLDIPALEESLGAIVNRHEILRTNLLENNDKPVQVVRPARPFVLPVTDLSRLAGEAQSARVQELARSEFSHCFNLATDPLFRASLLRLADDRHILLTVVHHAVFDGWSTAVFLRELSAIYKSRVKGLNPELPDPPIQYADYAAWQRRMLEGEILETQIDYWRTQLQDAPELLDLTKDRPRPARQSYAGEVLTRHLPASLRDQLNEIARGESASLYMVLMAAFQLLLSRLSGTKDILVGSPIAGRNRVELENLIGFFLNTLVIRGRLDDSMTWRDFLRQIRETTLGAFAHQDVPFEKLLEELRPPRSTAHTPLFQVMFVLQNTPTESLRLADLEMEPLNFESGGAKFDLNLHIHPDKDGLHAVLSYNTDIFDRARVEELLAQFEILLTQIAENPDAPIAAYSLQTPNSRPLLPDPTAPLSAPWDGSVVDFFSRQVRDNPDAIALVDSKARWSYAKLDQLSNELARRLVSEGLRPGDTVAIHARRSAALVWALLGVVKAGGVFLILDAAYPVLRLKRIVEIARPKALLLIGEKTELPPDLEKSLNELSVKIRFALPLNPPEKFSDDAGDLSVSLSTDSPAYLAFTSGTTGEPKGLPGTHGPLAHFIRHHIRRSDFSGSDRFSMLSGLSHDPLLRDIFTPLACGATLCVPDEERLAHTGPWLRDEKISVCHLTPAMASVIGQSLLASAPSPNEGRVPTLRHAFFGGEQLTRETARDFRSLAPNARIHNCYGATETPQVMAWDEAPETADLSNNSSHAQMPIGRGIENVQILILTSSNSLAGIGEIGEICVRTPHLTRGYVNDPELTRQRFVTNPFTNDARDRIYRTGDLGAWLPDGRAVVLGRADRQISIRGFRVELDEIRSALLSHPHIQNAVVSVNHNADHDNSLIAHIIEEREIDLLQLRLFLAQRIPAFMIPSAFLPVSEIPLTPSGKIDYAALPKPESTNMLGRQAFVAPRTRMEEQVARIWEEILRREPIGVFDNFFDMGGHSLMATQVVSRLRRNLGVEIPLRAIFERPNVAAFAQLVEGSLLHVGDNALPPITRGTQSEGVPLSYSQERMWFLHELDPESRAYNMSTAFELLLPVKPDILERAVRELAIRHDMLRVTFHAVDGQPVQTIHDEPKVSFEFYDLGALPAESRVEEAKRLAVEVSRETFDLARGPLFRMRLYRIDKADHIVLISMHHIISDIWSFTVLSSELAAIYKSIEAEGDAPAGEGRKAAPDWTAPPIRYADYAIWQKKHLRDETLREQLEYWKDLLKDSKNLELPTDHVRPAERKHIGERRLAVIPAELYADIRLLCKHEKSTPFMVLLTAFKILLSRYCGQNDILVGSPIANRHRLEVEAVLGTFVNTLPLRTRLDGNLSFRETLNRVREGALRAFAHQDTPFEKIVEEMQPERDLSTSPLVQVLFNVANNAGDDETGMGTVWRPVVIDRGSAQFDLTMAIALRSEPIVSLEYDCELFDGWRVDNMLRQYTNILRSIVKSPDQLVGDIDLFDEAEKKTLLEEWNNTAVAFPDRRFHQLVEECATVHPDKTAVRFEARSIGFDSLNRRANQLARRLLDRGVGPGVFVGIIMERSIDMIVAILAIHKAGGAYLPMDPGFPMDRLQFMVEDTRAPLILSHRLLIEHLRRFFNQDPAVESSQTTDDRVLFIDSPEADIEVLDDRNLEATVPASSPAYIIYTSGSTGKPKGVVIPHSALVNFLCSMRKKPGLAPSDTILAVTTLSFDIAGLEILLPLVTGATVAIASRETALDGVLLGRLIQESGATVIQATPATWKLLIETGWTGDPNLKLLCGGEAMAPEIARDLLARCGELWNMYGPTETTIWSTIERVTDHKQPILIGRPIDNTDLYILDSRLRLVPVGVPGELMIGGAGVALGYHNRPELTAERFIKNPFAADRNRRVYRTGDMARWRPDGRVECLGRADNQVKIRGYRIELGEIESALAAHPDIEQAVVSARPDKTGGKRLVAWMIAAERRPSPHDLRAFLQKRLPDYMMPSAFMYVEMFPLTPNGKIDRKMLPDPDPGQTGRHGDYVSPRNPVEQKIADIWRDILGVEKVGVHDNFFELGGHSLSASRLIARIRKTFDLDMPLRSVFVDATVAGLAAQVDQASVSTPADEPPALAPRDAASPVPISNAQKRLWFIHQLEPESPAYNIVGAIRMTGELDEDAFHKAFEHVYRRHETLRSCFPEENGGPVVRIREDQAPLIRIVSGQGGQISEEAALQHIQIETYRPFDLANGPLIRPILINLSPNDHIFAFIIHHIISDGWSLGIFTRELGVAYSDILQGRPVSLRPLPIQYGDYVAWQEKWLETRNLRLQADYWKSNLGGAKLPVLQMPTDRPRPSVPTYFGATDRLELSAELTKGLNDLARREGSTLFMVLLAAFQTILHRYSRQDDIIVGSPIANRNRVETEQLIGFFINMLPMKGELGGNLSFIDLIRQVRQTALDAYANQDLPFERLVEILQPVRDMSHHPIFQVMFAFQNYPSVETKIEKLRIQPISIYRGVTQMEISLYMFENGDRVLGYLEYSVDLFDPATIRVFISHFQNLLESAARAPETPIRQLDMLSDDERRLLVYGWNQTSSDYPREATFPALFESQAGKTPRRVAAVDEKGDSPRGWGECPGSLTFDQLNRVSNRLAHGLIQKGVGPETLVGVYTERSLEMLVAVLAVLKAGGAYLPLDPYFPEDRLAFMAEDTQARIVITQSSLRASAERLVENLPHPPALYSIDTEWGVVATSIESNPAPRASADNLAYVIYTSGSTGKPKGVPIHHRGLVNYLFAMLKEPGFSQSDIFLAIATLSFDISTLELLLPLMIGAKTLILTRESAYDGGTLIKALESNKITVMQATPVTWRMLLDAGWRRAPGLKALCGGEALTAQLASQILGTGAELWNLYGPTETTVWSSVSRVRPDTGAPRLGGPIANMQYYVIDELNQIVPLGIPGELLIGGDGVARGYVNREELNRKTFIANPLLKSMPGSAGFAVPSPRLYRSGDLVRRRPDGTFDFLGRMDNQVKVRGYRIELGEIEATLVQCPGVKEAVVATRADRTGENSLVSWIIADSTPPPEIPEIRDFLRRTLPEYMLPTSFLFLEAYPLTPSGKIDRRALPNPDADMVAAHREYTAPRNKTEEIIAGIWREILNVERVGVEDNFFDLGGHSLSASRLIAKVRQTFKLDIPLRSVFIDATVSGLAKQISQSSDMSYQFHESKQTWKYLVPMQPFGPARPFFLVAGAHAEEDEFLRYLSNLIPHIGKDQPVFGFKPRGLDGLEEPPASVEEMAQDYLRELQAFQPQGPYLLGGECVGGVVAFEMARQLIQRGEKVGLLMLLDTRRPTPKMATRFKVEIFNIRLRRMAEKMRRILRLGLSRGGRELLEILKEKRRYHLPMNEKEIREKRIRRLEEIYPRMMFRYLPKPYSERLTLLVNETLYAHNPSIGWEDLAQGGLEIHVVPGNHITRLTQHGKTTARILRQCLDQAQRSVDPESAA